MTMYIYCVYLAILKGSKQLPNCRLYTDILLLLNAMFLKFYRNSDRIDYFHGNLGFDNLILRKSG
jgi:hypothetical protein